MGFRDPVTSADPLELDTNPEPTGPGARLYQGADVLGNPQGVLQFRSGLVGDVPAHIRLTSYQAPDEWEPETLVPAGSVLEVFGGITGGVDAPPEILLEIENGSLGWLSRLRLNAGVVEVNGVTLDPRQGGVVPGGYGESAVATATTGTAEQRLSGPQNITAAELVPGRAYEPVCAVRLNAVGAGGLVACRLRASYNAFGPPATPTTSSVLVGTAMRSLTAAGGTGQQDADSSGQLFQVSAPGFYAVHTFGIVLAGSATSMSVVPDSRLIHNVTIKDAGRAPSNLRMI
jgi:hypothetical protein